MLDDLIRRGVTNISGKTVVSTGQITRPNKSQDYSPNQIVCNEGGSCIIFNNAVEGIGNAGIILNCTMTTTSNPDNRGSFVLHLFSEPTSNFLHDGADVSISNDDLVNHIGAILFREEDSFITNNNSDQNGSCVYTSPMIIPTCFNTREAQRLFGVLVTNSNYSGAPYQRFIVKLDVELSS